MNKISLQSEKGGGGRIFNSILGCIAKDFAILAKKF
jgi:hypothetical protein